MRRSYHNKKFLVENGVFLGVSLGSDFCAEHEWGIGELKEKLGITSTGLGIENRIIHDNTLVVMKQQGHKTLIRTVDRWRKKEFENKSFVELLPFDLKNHDSELDTAWSSSDFAVVSSNGVYMQELWEAFQKNDIAIASLKGFIENASLCILIASKIPKEFTDAMYKVDKKAQDLIAYEKEIGLTDLKERVFKSVYSDDFDASKHKYYMACSPSWFNYNNENQKAKEEKNTKYDIQYWLNYADNKDYGWFRVEDVKEWLETPNVKLVDIANKNKRPDPIEKGYRKALAKEQKRKK